MPRCLTILLALALGFSQFAYGQGLELKGIALGISKTQLDEKLPNLRCAVRSSPEVKSKCRYEYTYQPSRNVSELDTLAEETVSSWEFEFYDERLVKVTISFAESSFDPIAGALTNKYGKPKVKESQVQNLSGAKFRNTELTWSRKEATLLAWRYLATIKTSAIVLVDNSHLSGAMVEETKKTEQRRAKDL